MDFLINSERIVYIQRVTTHVKHDRDRFFANARARKIPQRLDHRAEIEPSLRPSLTIDLEWARFDMVIKSVVYNLKRMTSLLGIHKPGRRAEGRGQAPRGLCF